MKRLIAAAILVLMLTAGSALAGNGSQSDYDVRWHITVINGCNDTEKVYRNCYITGQGQTYLKFVPNQMAIGEPNGKAVHVTTVNGCTSVVRVEAD